MEKQKKLTDILKKEIINPIRTLSKNYKPSLTDYLIVGGYAVAANVISFSVPESKGVLDQLSQMGYTPLWSYAFLSCLNTVISAMASIPVAMGIELIRHYDKYASTTPKGE